MQTFSVQKDFSQRFKEYISSQDYQDVPSYSKSEYWKYHSDKISIQFNGEQISVDGVSGYYFPDRKKTSDFVLQKFNNVITNPDRFFKKVKQKMQSNNSRIKLMNYFEAFDAIMTNDPIADIQLHSDRINFQDIKQCQSSVKSISEMQQRFFARDKFSLNAKVIYSYYLYNILLKYVGGDQIRTMVDIGAGNGNLSAILRSEMNAKTYIVDLPETLCFSILFLHDLFPEAKITMPHEATAETCQQADIVFLTPNQLNLMADDSIDLATNTFSFQEMTQQQIQEYYDFIQRITKSGGYFLTANRIEKIPTYGDTLESFQDHKSNEGINRFYEYPWKAQNETVLNEICRLIRLVQIDNCGLRLEKIHK